MSFFSSLKTVLQEPRIIQEALFEGKINLPPDYWRFQILRPLFKFRPVEEWKHSTFARNFCPLFWVTNFLTIAYLLLSPLILIVFAFAWLVVGCIMVYEKLRQKTEKFRVHRSMHALTKIDIYRKHQKSLEGCEMLLRKAGTVSKIGGRLFVDPDELGSLRGLKYEDYDEEAKVLHLFLASLADKKSAEGSYAAFAFEHKEHVELLKDCYRAYIQERFCDDATMRILSPYDLKEKTDAEHLRWLFDAFVELLDRGMVSFGLYGTLDFDFQKLLEYLDGSELNSVCLGRLTAYRANLLFLAENTSYADFMQKEFEAGAVEAETEIKKAGRSAVKELHAEKIKPKKEKWDRVLSRIEKRLLKLVPAMKAFAGWSGIVGCAVFTVWGLYWLSPYILYGAGGLVSMVVSLCGAFWEMLCSIDFMWIFAGFGKMLGFLGTLIFFLAVFYLSIPFLDQLAMLFDRLFPEKVKEDVGEFVPTVSWKTRKDDLASLDRAEKLCYGLFRILSVVVSLISVICYTLYKVVALFSPLVMIPLRFVQMVYSKNCPGITIQDEDK